MDVRVKEWRDSSSFPGTFFPIPLLKSGDKEDINRLIPFRIHFPPFHSQDPELDSGSSEVEKEDVLTEFWHPTDGTDTAFREVFLHFIFRARKGPHWDSTSKECPY